MSQNQRRPPLPYVMMISGGLLLIISIILWVTSGRSTGPITNTSLLTGASGEATYPEIPRVSLDEAKKAFDAKSAIFLDVRDADSFADSHIPGAINIPLWSMEDGATDLDPEAWIITYCT